MKELHTFSARQSIALGTRIGRAAPSGGLIAFRGGLGAGKTTLSKGIARGLGIAETLWSPTFSIIAEYPEGRLLLRHIDAYRLTGDDDFAEIGGPELLGEAGTLCLVEWSERLPGNFPGPESAGKTACAPQEHCAPQKVSAPQEHCAPQKVSAPQEHCAPQICYIEIMLHEDGHRSIRLYGDWLEKAAE